MSGQAKTISARRASSSRPDLRVWTSKVEAIAPSLKIFPASRAGARSYSSVPV